MGVCAAFHSVPCAPAPAPAPLAPTPEPLSTSGPELWLWLWLCCEGPGPEWPESELDELGVRLRAPPPREGFDANADACCLLCPPPSCGVFENGGSGTGTCAGSSCGCGCGWGCG